MAPELTSPKHFFFVWLGAALLVCGLAWQTFSQGINLRADMLALFPDVQQHPGSQAAVDSQAEALERLVVMAINFDSQFQFSNEELFNLANRIEDTLTNSGVVSATPSLVSFAGLREHAYRLLSPSQRAAITADPAAELEKARRALFGLAQVAEPIDLATDPLGLHAGYVAQFTPAGIQPLTSHVFLLEIEPTTLLVSLNTDAVAFDMQRSSVLLAAMDEIEANLTEYGARVRASGLPVFAAHGAESARGEISLFGTLSIVGVLAVLLATFRALRPMLSVFLLLGLAVGCAFVVTHTVFAEVHLITLVFGVSLIGISVDYSFHYLCDMWRESGWRPTSGLKSVMPGISLAMATSALAFLTFFFAPFPGLKQMAVFSASGLVFAWLSVMGLLPWLGPQAANAAPTRGLSAMDWWLVKWPLVRGPAGFALLALLVAGGLWGITRLAVNDHISMLQTAPDELLRDDAYVRSLSPEQRASQFYLVEAVDEEKLLAAETSFISLLQSQGVEATGLSQVYPDAHQQQADHVLLEAAYFAAAPGESSRLQKFYRSLGADELYGQVQARFQSQGPISLSDWVANAPPQLQSLWLGCEEGVCRSVVALAGADDLAMLRDLAESSEQIIWVDQVGAISALLGEYRVAASQLLIGVLIVLSIGFVWMFDWRRGLSIVAVPVLAILSALAIFGWSGQPFSLFNLLGLMMVFGISIDYALFYCLHGNRKPTTALAISLSAATTLLAFGMLSFSSTTIVHTVGMTLAVGIFSAYLIGPLAARWALPVGDKQA